MERFIELISSTRNQYLAFFGISTAIFLFVLTWFKGLRFENSIWPCMLIVASIEPVFQTALGSTRPYPTWVIGYVFLHIFTINFCQLLIFKHYDFVSMYSFRLVYYTFWYIVWENVRLNLLF